MTPEAILPWVSKSLQAIFRAKRAAWVADPQNELYPLPKRYTKKRKPIPGLYDWLAEDEG